MTQQHFSRIAILNRGEAAIRFMRAARTWSGIHGEPLETVAFYTTPDRDALFVRMATHAVNLGDALVAGPEGKLRSAYLDVDRVIALTKEAGATAIWPGWGFLAESAEFAQACEDNGITFIGPTSAAIRLLGDKIEAKRLAEKHGVPVTAWSQSGVEDVEHAKAMAERIGLPLMIKASAGGGGRGIRIVRAMNELEEAFDSARSEALSAFGNAEVLMEQLVGEARHIEVQLIGDRHGRVWALGTRDCSVQRRHQKLIEEAPAPGLDAELEAEMCRAAIAVARASNYVGAGTAEFLYEPDTEKFYFLEMNTRLQVEHTITEEIYGVDLAVQQILVAQGKQLPSPTPPTPRGAAVELRLNAENPDENFAPSAGTIVRFEAPQGPGIRFDSGYASGDTIPSEFDSNIAKVIASGTNRLEAWARLQTVLRDTVVAITGGPTNRSLLMELVNNEKLRQGPVTTNWLDGYLEQRMAPEDRPGLGVALAAAAVGDHLRLRRGVIMNFLSDAQRGLPQRGVVSGETRRRYRLGSRTFEVSVGTLAPGLFRVTCAGGSMDLRAVNTGIRTMVIEESDGTRHAVIRIATSAAVYVDVDGIARTLTRISDGSVLAPTPAAVTRVHVSPGDAVTMGDRLVTLEVMKMESSVESPQTGVVREVHVGPASRVAAGDPLVTIDEDSSVSPDDAEAPASPFPELNEPLNALETVRRIVLGYDIDRDAFNEAVGALERSELEATRSELVGVLEMVLLQDSLFARGAFDDARSDSGEPSADQLLRFIRHPLGAEEALSPLFKSRVDRMLALHGVSGHRRSFELEAALVRLFQGDVPVEHLNRLLFALVEAILGTEGEEESRAALLHNRETLERFAHFAVRNNRRLAQLVWQVIFRLYDQPALISAARNEEVEAGRRIAALIRAPEEAKCREAVLEMSLGALLGSIGYCAAQSREHCVGLLRSCMEHLYEVEPAAIVEERREELLTMGFAREGAGAVVGVLVSAHVKLRAVVEFCSTKDEVDILMEREPSESEVHQLVSGLGGVSRVTLLWAGRESGIAARTFVDVEGSLKENELIRNLHPARPIVRDIERWKDFSLERLEAPGDIFLARAIARDGSGDDRLVVLAEVDRFDPRRAAPEAGGITLPAFERAFINAVYSVSQALTNLGLGEPVAGRGNRNRLVWNRISFFYRPIVRLRQAEIEHIVARLSPWTPGLGLEKVSVEARFVAPGDVSEKIQAMCVEWSEPTRSASVLNFQRPISTPHRVLSPYEQRVVEARRAGKFYPYELIRALTTRAEGTGFVAGEFEELELGEAGLVSVKDRPWGENVANLVVGRLTNEHPRFPRGLTRVVIIGDPTRSMGALAEPECARIIGALDYAEENNLPVEWVPVSSGAKIAFDSGTENLDWTARVLRRIILFTQAGGVINIIVDGVCV
ncbi:MAG: biotin carboxylase N-terminal domain-containing protein, partial [Myxococcota bacterium]|nr:biotin carboxylase N-terminal domain-containing protein [Myxococcota bacterium]